MPDYTLINACFASLAEAEELLNSSPQLLEARTGLGETALHYLAVEDHLAAVEWLAGRGASVNVVNDVGTTPLSDAAALGYVEMTNLLLRLGAQVNLFGESEPTVLVAARAGNALILKSILAAGANVLDCSEGEETSLHAVAAACDAPEIIHILVQAGARVDALYFGETPIKVAQRHGHKLVAEALASYSTGVEQ